MTVSAETIIIAHRGASAVAPENTRSAIKMAIGMGAKVIEFDVRETSDGVLVLFHDDELNRLVGRKGEIEAMTWDEVKDLDVGTWFRGGEYAGEKLMRFDDAVKLCQENKVIPLIERKTGKAESYAAVLTALDVADEVIVQSFSWTFIKEMKDLLPGLETGALGSKELDAKKLAQLAELKPDWVGWNFKDLTVEGFNRLKTDGYRIALWTVNDAEESAKWIAQGIDGVITDYPDKMLELLEE